MSTNTNISAATAATTTFTVAGKPLTVAPLGIAGLNEYCRWVKSWLPNPVAELAGALDGLPESAQRIALEHAVDRLSRPVTVGSPEFNAAITSVDGIAKLIGLALRTAGNPAAAEDVLAAVSAADGDGGKELAEAIFTALSSVRRGGTKRVEPKPVEPESTATIPKADGNSQ